MVAAIAHLRGYDLDDPRVRDAVLALRRGKGMVLDDPASGVVDHDTWSAGSFFTNPIVSAPDFERMREAVHARCGADAEPPRFDAPDGQAKTSAAWLIDRAGFGKGFTTTGRAALSSKHTLAVTNRGGASAADVIDLARTVRAGVRDAFGVTLVNEPVLVGMTL